MSCVLGVDIGGTTIKVGVVEAESGNIAAEASVPTPEKGAPVVAAAVADAALAMLATFPELSRMGVGVPGSMNRDRTLVRYPPNLLGWKEEPLQRYLAELLPNFSMIEVDNDANVAALAEAKLGAGKDLLHFLLVTLGTGVGGAIYASEPPPYPRLEKAGESSNRIYRGVSGGAGEFGHTSIDYNGARCNCGSRGCIEAYLGQRYLSERTKQKLQDPPTIVSVLRNEEDELTPKRIAEAMNAGDAFARSVFEEAGTMLGAALANVANLLDMHTFILGGGVAEAGAVLFDAALRSLQSRVLANLRSVVEIRKAHFGNRAGMIGAAMLVAGQP